MIKIDVIFHSTLALSLDPKRSPWFESPVRTIVYSFAYDIATGLQGQGRRANNTDPASRVRVRSRHPREPRILGLWIAIPKNDVTNILKSCSYHGYSRLFDVLIENKAGTKIPVSMKHTVVKIKRSRCFGLISSGSPRSGHIARGEGFQRRLYYVDHAHPRAL